MGDLTIGATIFEQTTSQNLAIGALSFTTSFGTDIRLGYITFHFSSSVTQTVTVTIDALAGATFDTVIDEVKLNTESDYILQLPDLLLKKGNELRIQCTNTATPASIVYVVASVEQE